jgi:hypothetical protein
MKKLLLAISVLLVIIFFGYLLSSKSQNSPKKFDHRIKYSTQSYRPYDIKFLFDALGIGKNTQFVVNNREPSFTNLLFKGNNNLYVVASPHFMTSVAEAQYLREFAEKGNDVFVSAFNISSDFLNELALREEEVEYYNHWPAKPFDVDSIKISWYSGDSLIDFEYPGADSPNYNRYLFESEEDSSQILLIDEYGMPILRKYPVGEGHIFMMLKPMALTNYFLLHRQNYRFLNLLFGELGVSYKRIIWDDFYRFHPAQRYYGEPTQPGESYFWNLVKSTPALAWAISVFFLGLFLFLITYARRMQSPIGVIPEVKNNSMAFVEALTTLFWYKQDHKKIADKLILHWSDSLHQNHKIMLRDLNPSNVKYLAQKTGKTEAYFLDVFEHIQSLEIQTSISKKQLFKLYSKVSELN